MNPTNNNEVANVVFGIFELLILSIKLGIKILKPNPVKYPPTNVITKFWLNPKITIANAKIINPIDVVSWLKTFKIFPNNSPALIPPNDNKIITKLASLAVPYPSPVIKEASLIPMIIYNIAAIKINPT